MHLDASFGKSPNRKKRFLENIFVRMISISKNPKRKVKGEISKMPIVWPKFQKCPELFIKFQKCPNLCGKFQKCPNLRQKCQFCPNISRKFHFCPKLLSKFQKRQRSMFIPASSFGGMTNQTIQTIVSESLKCEAVGEEGLPATSPCRRWLPGQVFR